MKSQNIRKRKGIRHSKCLVCNSQWKGSCLGQWRDAFHQGHPVEQCFSSWATNEEELLIGSAWGSGLLFHGHLRREPSHGGSLWRISSRAANEMNPEIICFRAISAHPVILALKLAVWGQIKSAQTVTSQVLCLHLTSSGANKQRVGSNSSSMSSSKGIELVPPPSQARMGLAEQTKQAFCSSLCHMKLLKSAVYLGNLGFIAL